MIKTHLWMMVHPFKRARARPIIHTGMVEFTRKSLIARAEKEFFNGVTWAYIRKTGWRAVKFEIRGRI